MNEKFHEYVTSASFNLSISAPQIRYLSALYAEHTQNARWRAVSTRRGHPPASERSRGITGPMNLHIILKKFRVGNFIATASALENKGLIERKYQDDGDGGVTRIYEGLTKAGIHVCVLLKESGQLIRFAEPGDHIDEVAFG